MKRGVLTICLFLFVFLFSISCSSAGEFFLRLTGEKMTLHANQTPLADILKEIQDQGVSVQLDPTINPRVTARFDEKPVERVFSSIIKQYNYSLVWQKDGSSEESKLRLAEVRIFHPGRETVKQSSAEAGNLLLERADDGRFFVKNSLLLRLTRALTKEQLNSILNPLGASVSDSFPELGIIRIDLPDHADPEKIISKLSANNQISLVEPDYAYPLEGNRAVSSVPEPMVLTLDTVPPDSAPVAVLDSGLLQHYSGSPFVSGFYDAFSNGQKVLDPVGHGTQMSLIASGMVSPLGTEGDEEHNNSIVAVRAFDDNGFTSNSTLLRSIDYAISAKARVVSMSWGAQNSNEMLEAVINYATDKGLIVVAAAGNSPTGRPVYPAAYSEVIGVGALMPDGARWENSNYGDFVSVYAPGIAEIAVGHNGTPGTYIGTSISTAYIANQVAEILEDKPGADREKIVEELTRPR